MRAERIDSSLNARSWSFNRRPEAPARHLLVLGDGAAEVDLDGVRHAVVAPAVGWFGAPAAGRLGVAAGATGWRASAANPVLAAAIGDGAEASQLRHLAGRSFVLSLAGRGAEAALLARCLEEAREEAARPREATALVLSAQLRLVLATLMRLSGGPAAARAGAGEADGLLQRFRQLVEMNFRSRWPVARYAAALGVSTDRLHAICTRATGRPPKALISERLAREAALRLPRSSLTIEQLAYTLGFDEPAQFSTFFKRVTGVPPGRYRKAAAAARAGGVPPPALSLDDWP